MQNGMELKQIMYAQNTTVFHHVTIKRIFKRCKTKNPIFLTHAKTQHKLIMMLNMLFLPCHCLKKQKIKGEIAVRSSV